MKKEQNVLERVYEPRRLLEAWQQVKRNAGAAGVDQMTVEEFEDRKEQLFPMIHKNLKAGTYRFKPARRKEIPKRDGKGKTRKLGIPVVMDRIVAQSVHTVFQEIFDPEFTESNFGLRRGKSQHQAIKYVHELVKADYRWCASTDLKSFFDEIPHNLILKLIRRRMAHPCHQYSVISCSTSWTKNWREEVCTTHGGPMILSFWYEPEDQRSE